jgi:hypothetical protein
MLREVPLLNQPETRPYANATMSIERFKLSELYPTTRYVQASLVASQGSIRDSLLTQGYDQLDLRNGGILIDSGQGPQRIMPPIVERYEVEGEHRYILDGGHRAELARRVALASGEKEPELTVIFIRDGIAYPPYAFVNDWDEVQVVKERPIDKSTWKNYRDFEHRYSLYRDYSKIVHSAPRG